MARGLRRTPESIATPCSVKALGSLRVPPQLDIPKWNFKSLNSFLVRRNIKSSGKRSMLRVTALLRLNVVTPYKAAKSLSRMTFCPLIRKIRDSILATGISDFSAIPSPQDSLRSGPGENGTFCRDRNEVRPDRIDITARTRPPEAGSGPGETEGLRFGSG